MNGFGSRAEILIAEPHVRACLADNRSWAVFGTTLLHAGQELHGKPGKCKDHNREFRRRALEVGLMVDERGRTTYDPGSPFFIVLDREGIDVPSRPAEALPTRAEGQV